MLQRNETMTENQTICHKFAQPVQLGEIWLRAYIMVNLGDVSLQFLCSSVHGKRFNTCRGYHRKCAA